jgi:leucyl aminopeptidase (aminopeptidase T)
MRQSAIVHLLTHCGSLQHGETLVIICDPRTRPIADRFVEQARTITRDAEVAEIPYLGRHGLEPPEDVARRMCDSDLVMSLCTQSLAHSRARIEAGRHGARFLSMPGYNDSLLNDPAIVVDYRSVAPTVRAYADAFTAGSEGRVQSQRGTDVHFTFADRRGNYCPGFVEQPGDLGSPPDIEANVSPLETSAEGTIVIDGSITHDDLGLLETPIILTVTAGKIIAIAGDDEKAVQRLEEIMGPVGSPTRVLAECGIGMNPLAQLTGAMLTDEGVEGYIHFGFGANSSVGGLNDIDFHLDFVLRDPDLYIDGRMMVEGGRLCVKAN